MVTTLVPAATPAPFFARAAPVVPAVTAALLLLACVPRSSGVPVQDPSTSATTPGGALEARFLDVGQGDSALLVTSDGHALLVDAGPPQAASRVNAALASLGRATLDAVVVSHAHADHLGELDVAARSIPLGRWIDPGYAAHAVATYPRALAALRARHVPTVRARRGDRFPLGAHVDVEVLEPRDPLFEHTRSDLNANSVVLRVVHHATSGDARVLFEGDAEHPTEERLLADAADGPRSLRADVLKVAHHGSRHASSPAMLDAVSPRLAVVSCGAGNDYGHPHAATLRRLEAHGAVIARTDLEGDVTVTSDERGVRWSTARPASRKELMIPGRELVEAP
jgi:beta-lactamase superfamily II metal-dependent hydrolase